MIICLIEQSKVTDFCSECLAKFQFAEIIKSYNLLRFINITIWLLNNYNKIYFQFSFYDLYLRNNFFQQLLCWVKIFLLNFINWWFGTLMAYHFATNKFSKVLSAPKYYLINLSIVFANFSVNPCKKA